MADDEFYYVGGGDRVRGRSAMQCIDDADVLRWASGLLRDSLAAEVWSNVRRIGWVSADSCDARGVHVGTLVGSEQSVPEEVNHRKIGVRVQMVDKVKLLLAPEPSEACEARSFGVICFVEIYVRAERRCTGGAHYDKQIERKNKKHPTCDKDCGEKKVRRVVPFVATIGG